MTQTNTLKMRNIGPKSSAWLRQVGLRTQEDIATAGPVDAFMRVKRAGFRPSLNLLYALEGAFFTGALKKQTLKGLETYYAAIRAAALLNIDPGQALLTNATGQDTPAPINTNYA